MRKKVPDYLLRVGPLVWNVMYDDFLRMDLPAGTSTIGFADDSLVVCDADDVRIMEPRKETFQFRKELTCLTYLQEIADPKEAIRQGGRHRLVEKWQARWHGDQSGSWTHRLIPELATWLDRKHGQDGFYLAQALSGHGCFNAYLK